MALEEWIEVKGAQAKLFINGHKQPALVVNDLKHGPEASGAVGLWVDVGTEGNGIKLRSNLECWFVAGCGGTGPALRAVAW